MGVMVTAAQKKYGCKYPRKRELCKPSAATYKCKDGEYISIAAAQYERVFPKLCAVLGIPEVAGLPEYRLAPLLGEHSEQGSAELGYSQEQIAQFEKDSAIFAAK